MGNEEEEKEAEEKWMNKGNVYFRGRPCSVHLKIVFFVMRARGKVVDEKGRQIKIAEIR